MARFNGMPGSANSMMKQFQKMQKQMKEQAKAFESRGLEATVGGGAMRVTVIGGREANKVTLDRDVVDPSNVKMPEDPIEAAVNEILHMAETENQQMMGKLAGGLPF